jgi:formylglycine-generating enzyme required for sulfatase activity
MPVRRYLALALAVVLLGAGLVVWRASTKATPPAVENHASGDGHASVTAAPATPSPQINAANPPGPAPPGMIWVPGGTFWMGCGDCGMADAEPLHLVTVDGFWIDAAPVTNAQFEKFVRATGYVTIAERPLDPKQFPGVPVSKLVPGSAVFVAPDRVASLDNPMQWWHYVNGASWQRPEGRGSSLAGRADHPVVHIAWDDAVAYLTWAGKALPTEAPFEFAARGGLDRNRFAWGNDLHPHGRAPANIWQGTFPVSNTRADGFHGTSPVTAFPANGFGLYDMGGNVWQWCADWYRPDYYSTLPPTAIDPQGPPDSFDPAEPGVPKRVQRGGSFLCSEEYCTRYLVGSRGKGATDSGGSNVSFRGVKEGS